MTEKKKKDTTEWRDYTLPGERPEMHHWKTGSTYCKVDDKRYFSNYQILTGEEGNAYKANYFVLNRDLLEKMEEQPPRTAFTCLKAYANYYDDEFVVRAFQDKHVWRVFTDDILELIPLIMKKQKRPLKHYGSKIQQYRNKWALTEPHFSNTVTLDEFKQVMEGLKVKKSLILILPDLMHHANARRVLERGMGPAHLVNRNGVSVTTAEQAIFNIFQYVICNRTWTIEGMETEICNEFQLKYFEIANKYFNLKEGLMISREYVMKDVAELSAHRVFKDNIINSRTPTRFDNVKFCSLVDWKDYQSECIKFDLYILQDKPNSKTMPCFAARFNLILAWIEAFYPPYCVKYKMAVQEGLLWVLPEEFRDKCRETNKRSYDRVHEQYNEACLEKEMERPTTSDSAQKRNDSQRLLRMVRRAAKEEWARPGATASFTGEAALKYKHLFEIDELTGEGKIDIPKLLTMASTNHTEVTADDVSDCEDEFRSWRLN